MHAFRVAEKKYKQNNNEDVLNIEDECVREMLKNKYDLIVIPNAISISMQKNLIIQALCKLPPGNVCNVNLTQATVVAHQSNNNKGNDGDNDVEDDNNDNKSERIGYVPSFFTTNDCKKHIWPKMTWLTLGYHYDWTKRVYDFNCKSDFPVVIADLVKELVSKYFKDACEDHHHDDSNNKNNNDDKSIGIENKNDFIPEAAIINYYHDKKGFLCGHKDDAELRMDLPIVSISIGCTAIFLIGGESKDETPTAIYLRSGDLMFMAGKARVSYHGIPKIIENSCPLELLQSFKISDNHSNNDLFDYINCHRININVRQVK